MKRVADGEICRYEFVLVSVGDGLLLVGDVLDTLCGLDLADSKDGLLCL